MQRLMPKSAVSRALYHNVLQCEKDWVGSRVGNPRVSRMHRNVFINHRGIDTKKSVAGLLYDYLSRLGLHPFLDRKNMMPGDQLFERINSAIHECSVGVALFSPRYCESFFCLHELALMVEAKKRVVPIFCDVKAADLQVVDDGTCSRKDIERFEWALKEVRNVVGLNFDSSKEDWPEFLRDASRAIIRNLEDVESSS